MAEEGVIKLRVNMGPGSIQNTVGGVISRLKAGMRSFGESLSGWLRKLMSCGLSIRSLFGQVRRSVVDGMRTLAEQHSRTKAALDGLNNALQTVKVSLGSAFAPALETVMPILNRLCAALATAMNHINMFFSLLAGRGTYMRVVMSSAAGIAAGMSSVAIETHNASGGAEAMAKSMKSAAKAAGSAVRNLSGLDQMNIWKTKHSGGSGSGSDAAGGPTLEETEIPGAVREWVQGILDAIEAGDWDSVGERLAEKLNEAIDAWDADAWGRRLGRALQSGFTVFLSLADHLNIEGLGAKVAALLGNALHNIRPQDLGATLASGIKAAFRFAHGFLEGYTGPEIGQYLAGVVNGWFAKLRENDGWKKAGEDLNRVILGIINGLDSFLRGLDTDGIGGDLKNFFSGIHWADIWESLKDLAKTAADKIDWKGILDALWSVLGDVYKIAAEALYQGLKGKDTWTANTLRKLLFPERSVLDEAIDGFRRDLEAGLAEGALLNLSDAVTVNDFPGIAEKVRQAVEEGVQAGLSNEQIWRVVEKLTVDGTLNVTDLIDSLAEEDKEIQAKAVYTAATGKKLKQSFRNITARAVYYSAVGTKLKQSYRDVTARAMYYSANASGLKQSYRDITTRGVFTSATAASLAQAYRDIKARGVIASVVNALRYTPEISVRAKIASVGGAGMDILPNRASGSMMPAAADRPDMAALTNIAGFPMPVMATGTVIPPQAVYTEPASSRLSQDIQELKDLLSGLVGTRQDTPVVVNVNLEGKVNQKNLFDAVKTEARVQRRATGKDPFMG